MAARRRGKRNCILRFKPDLWGRVPESEGTVLFDGTVTLEGTEGMVTLSEAMVVGKTLTITLEGQTVTAECIDYEGAVAAIASVFFESAERNMSIAMPPGETTAYIELENVEPHIEGGEFSLKIVQSE